MKPDFAKVPVNAFFEYTLVERSGERAEILMPVREGYLQEEGVVQGGIISALADTTAVYVFYPDLDDTQGLTSIEFKMNFLRPAFADAGHLRAVAKVVRRGKRVGLCEVDVFQEERHVACGLFTYLVTMTDDENRRGS